MKRIVILIALLAAGAAFAGRYIPANGSSVRIEGTSTLHAWTMEGSVINGQISAPPLEQWNGAATAVITIPVTSIKSEHARMDRIMADALKAKTNPEIRFELTSADLQRSPSAFTAKTRGRLTIAGTTREIELDVQGTRGADGRYTLSGSAPIRMSDFGIKPPTAMMNTIRTGDDVKVSFRWVVEAK